MFTKKRKTLVFGTAIALLTLSVGCYELPEYYGPLCEQSAEGDWSPATSEDFVELDKAENYAWPYDPELEEELRSYMDGGWGILSGFDIDEEGLVVSPYGKTLNALELVVTTPGLEEYADRLARTRDSGFLLHGSCGEKAPGIKAATWKGKAGNRIDLYQSFYDLNVVARAGFLVHESAHALGCSGHVDDGKDRSWDDQGAFRAHVEFHAALYHAEGILDQRIRDAAKYEFDDFAGNFFVEPVDLAIEDLRPEG